MNIFESPSHFLDWSIDHKKLLGDNEKHFNDYYYNYIKKDGFEKNMKKYFDYNSLQVRNHITKMFKKKQDLNILEIGSGCGTESIFLLSWVQK